VNVATVALDETVAVEPAAPADTRYIGLATRTVAFAIDAAIVNAVALLAELGGALILSLFHLPQELKTVIAAIGVAAWILWSIGYFVGFWATTGVTPGNRIMQIKVEATDGQRIKPRRALLRCIGLLLAALPLFAGYVIILFDPRRRGFQDYLARTVVVESPTVSLAEARRARRRAERAAAAGTPGRSSHSGDDRRALASQT
jgi:uncharacterized RDD family membrane protein YckC